MYPQDLHIHTTFSHGDSAVVDEQTVELIAAVGHARTVGISDHFEYVRGGAFSSYRDALGRVGFKCGVEVDGHSWVEEAVSYPVDYFILHCRDRTADYRCIDTLLDSGKPVIIAHPNAFSTDLNRVPGECFLEINNRYVWRSDWERYYRPHVDRFRFVIGSDAHQPNWLSQRVARYVAARLGIKEHLIFSDEQDRD